MASVDEIVIRDAHAREIDAVSDLLTRSYSEYAASGDDPVELEAWKEYEADLADVRGRDGDGSVVIVAESSGRLVGTATFYPPGMVEDRPDSWAWIRLVGVDPGARGQRLARRLTEECIRRARRAGATVVGLNTATVMTIARAMYERMGFVHREEEDQQIAPGLFLYTYRLDL